MTRSCRCLRALTRFDESGLLPASGICDQMLDMKIALTGLTGRIGRPVYQGLAARGHEVVLLARASSVLPRLEPPPLRTVLGDFLSPEAWQAALRGVDAVIHLAGASGPTDDAVHINVQSCLHLCQSAEALGVSRIVYASSDCVLGHCEPPPGQSLFPFESFPVTEAHALRPTGVYGLSKQLAEAVLEAYARRGLDILALRLSHVWTEEDCRRRAQQANYEDAERARKAWAYLHIDDCVDAFVAAVESPPVSHRMSAVYIASADTMAEAPSDTVARMFYPGVPVPVPLVGHQSLFSTKGAQRVLGFTPRRSFREHL
jgi:nucleoside-diphosphate-sugar epimerase